LLKVEDLNRHYNEVHTSLLYVYLCSSTCWRCRLLWTISQVYRHIDTKAFRDFNGGTTSTV